MILCWARPFFWFEIIPFNIILSPTSLDCPTFLHKRAIAHDLVMEWQLLILTRDPRPIHFSLSTVHPFCDLRGLLYLLLLRSMFLFDTSSDHFRNCSCVSSMLRCLSIHFLRFAPLTSRLAVTNRIFHHPTQRKATATVIGPCIVKSDISYQYQFKNDLTFVNVPKVRNPYEWSSTIP